MIQHQGGRPKDMGINDPLEHRKLAARLANKAREEGRPSSWFEPLYHWAKGDAARVPWADMEPHPLLREWLADAEVDPGTRAAVAGCGLGDDAVLLAELCRDVWAFDVSPTAIDWARQRFPDSPVEFEVADLFALPAERREQFGLVVEIYTLQALSPESRKEAQAALAALTAPGGRILVVTRLRAPKDELGPVPWPLLLDEVESFTSFGLQIRRRWGTENLAGFELLKSAAPKTQGPGA